MSSPATRHVNLGRPFSRQIFHLHVINRRKVLHLIHDLEVVLLLARVEPGQGVQFALFMLLCLLASAEDCVFFIFACGFEQVEAVVAGFGRHEQETCLQDIDAGGRRQGVKVLNDNRVNLVVGALKGHFIEVAKLTLQNEEELAVAEGRVR